MQAFSTYSGQEGRGLQGVQWPREQRVSRKTRQRIDVTLGDIRRRGAHELRDIGVKFVPIRELAHAIDKVHIAAF